MSLAQRAPQPDCKAPHDGGIVAVSRAVSALFFKWWERPGRLIDTAAVATPLDAEDVERRWRGPKDPVDAHLWQVQTIAVMHDGAAEAIEAAADELARLIADCGLTALPPAGEPAPQPDRLSRPLAA